MTNSLATGYLLRNRPSLILKQKQKYLTWDKKSRHFQAWTKTGLVGLTMRALRCNVNKSWHLQYCRRLTDLLEATMRKSGFTTGIAILKTICFDLYYHISPLLERKLMSKNGFALVFISLMVDHTRSIWFLLKTVSR